MENFDPLGIHTGDSIVVAPSQTVPFFFFFFFFFFFETKPKVFGKKTKINSLAL